jgi:rSAM/selenodomain-associated transferase 2/rSAM/selenodomain-associated transferase 1
MKRNRIIIFTRFPEAGKCKTRLIPILGAEGAADLQRRMTARVIEIAKEYIRKEPDCDLEVRFYGGSNQLMAETFGEAYYQPQSGGDLGQRMFQAIGNAFLEGCRSIVTIGSDCPDISKELLKKAFDHLEQHDLVLGPALDGGYYLIGMKQPLSCIFPGNMPWGTKFVFKKTLRHAQKMNLSVFLLPKLADVDLPQDIAGIWHTPLLQGMQQPMISVVIPALNEASLIHRTIEASKIENVEIIVADGGSTDETRELAAKAGVKVIQCPCGRGRQLNEGALHASGRIIVFLHADTILPEGFASEVLTVLAKKNTVAGAFRLSITGKNWALGLVSFFTNLRSVLFQLPYGDQAIFIQKDQFWHVGGFPDIPIMEDYALVLRLKKLGRISISPKAVKTSGRRWDKLGYLRTLLINQTMIIGYHAGVPIEKLERFYLQHKYHQEEKIKIEV